MGFQCEEHENPADFFLDIINLCEKADKDWEKRGEQRHTFSLCILLVSQYGLSICYVNNFQ